ncbi:MAG: hypothetical protein AAGG46_07275 [Planctomycetota bacterium]
MKRTAAKRFVFIWREFAEAPSKATPLITLMFVGYLSGLGLIIWSGA